MDVRDALAYGRAQLADNSLSPHLDARLLLQHLLQVEQTYLIAHDDQPLTAVQEAAYRQQIARAAQGEPIPYIIGHAPFYGRDFHVSPAVLIPRPETELLVEAVANWAAQRRAVYIADVGTGSGCIAVTLARLLPQARIDAIDISADALAVARHNARQQNVARRIHFQRGHLLEPLARSPEVIVANLPYIAESEWTMVGDGVKWYEPVVALQGGHDGLELIGQLLAQATTRLQKSGAIFLEIGWRQGSAAYQLAQSYFPQARVEVKPDLAGLDRMVIIQTDDTAKDETGRP
jgi:release factor glutamine methyltransferase